MGNIMQRGAFRSVGVYADDGHACQRLAKFGAKQKSKNQVLYTFAGGMGLTGVVGNLCHE